MVVAEQVHTPPNGVRYRLEFQYDHQGRRRFKKVYTWDEAGQTWVLSETHTYLYDLVEGGWSRVAEGLEVPARSPPIRPVWEPVGKVGRAVVTPGIHDSNAALLPYLLAETLRAVVDGKVVIEDGQVLDSSGQPLAATAPGGLRLDLEIDHEIDRVMARG